MAGRAKSLCEGMIAMLPLFPLVLLLTSMQSIDTSIPDELGENPLAPAQSGMVQCYGPDPVAHSCQAIAAYRRVRDRVWTDTATILADPALPLTVDIQTSVTVQGGAVCGTLVREQVLAGTLRLLDRPVPADRALPVLVQLADSMAGTLGHEMCTRYVPVAGGLIARAKFAGITTPVAEQRVIWIRADAGFHVQPHGANRSGG
jgi:hypothetical protein